MTANAPLDVLWVRAIQSQNDSSATVMVTVEKAGLAAVRRTTAAIRAMTNELGEILGEAWG